MARTDNTTKRTDRADGRTSAWIAFWLGIGVSVAANVAHTWYPTPTGPTREQIAHWIALSPANTAENWQPGIGAQAAAAFWPLAVLLAIEMVTRINWPGGWKWAAARYGGLGVVAAVAAIISYQHMSGLLMAYGETGITTVVGPLAVDGLMIVASVALLATGPAATRPRRTAATTAKPAADKPAPKLVIPPPPAGDESEGRRKATDECLAALRAGEPLLGQKKLGQKHGISSRQAGYAQDDARQAFAAASNGSAQ